MPMASGYQNGNSSYPGQSDPQSSGSQDAQRPDGGRMQGGGRRGSAEHAYYTLMVSVNLEHHGEAEGRTTSNFVFPVIIPPSAVNSLVLAVPSIIRFVRVDDAADASQENSTFEFIRRSRMRRRMKELLRRSKAIPFNKTMEDKECCVCLSKFMEKEKVRKLTCDHIFHKNCIDEWLTKGDICCPICRKVPFEKKPS